MSMSGGFFYKTKEELVTDVIKTLEDKMGQTIDVSSGEPLRTIIEAITQEMDIQYWQMEQIYNGSYIDSAANTELTELVKILGVIRKDPIKAKGKVKFYREIPALMDYYIAEGTTIETYPDQNGITVRFKTTKSVTLKTGDTEVIVDVEAEEGGIQGNVVSGKVASIIDPPMGIESVTNIEPMLGGEDQETDDDLRERAKLSLEAKGMGTVDALKGNIEAIDGVNSASVVDMARGVGTADILILGDDIPMPQIVKDVIASEIKRVKAAGIDVIYIEPTVNKINITLSLVFDETIAVVIAEVKDKVKIAIKNYVDNLKIGQTLYLNQLRKVILNVDPAVLDLNITTPTGNITVNSTTVIRSNTITVS